MNNEIVDAICFIAVLRKKLQKLKDSLKEHKRLKNAVVNVGVYGSIDGRAPSVALNFDADIEPLINGDYHCVDITFYLEFRNEMWGFSTTIGLSSYYAGFHALDSIDNTYETLNRLILLSEKDADIMVEKFNQMIIDYLDCNKPLPSYI